MNNRILLLAVLVCTTCLAFGQSGACPSGMVRVTTGFGSVCSPQQKTTQSSTRPDAVLGTATAVSPNSGNLSGSSLRPELLERSKVLATVLNECKKHSDTSNSRSVADLQKHLGKEMTPKDASDIRMMLSIADDCTEYLYNQFRRDTYNTRERIDEISRKATGDDFRSLEAHILEYLPSASSQQSAAQQVPSGKTAELKQRAESGEATALAGTSLAQASNGADQKQSFSEVDCKKTENLDVYSQPSGVSALIASLKCGEEVVSLGGEYNGWAKIKTHNNHEGYVSALFLKDGSHTNDVRLAEKGDSDAQYRLGMMYARGDVVSQDFPQSASWFRKAAEQGNASAQYWIGSMYATGEGVTQDVQQAVSWYRKAAEQEYRDAQIELARRYASGTGLERDQQMAAYWYNRAIKSRVSAIPVNNLDTAIRHLVNAARIRAEATRNIVDLDFFAADLSSTSARVHEYLQNWTPYQFNKQMYSLPPSLRIRNSATLSERKQKLASLIDSLTTEVSKFRNTFSLDDADQLVVKPLLNPADFEKLVSLISTPVEVSKANAQLEELKRELEQTAQAYDAKSKQEMEADALAERLHTVVNVSISKITDANGYAKVGNLPRVTLRRHSDGLLLDVLCLGTRSGSGFRENSCTPLQSGKTYGLDSDYVVVGASLPTNGGIGYVGGHPLYYLKNQGPGGSSSFWQLLEACNTHGNCKPASTVTERAYILGAIR